MILGLLVAGAFALATVRRYSLAQTATLTSLAFFLSSGLNGVSGAPVYGLRATFPESNEMEAWVHPCGTPLVANVRKTAQRHSVHRALKRVRTQLKVAYSYFQKDRKDIQDVYSKVFKELKEHYMMNWLPEKQLEWYHREVWCLEKGKKAEMALPRLHDALQRFAITFHHLRRFRLSSNVNADLTLQMRNRIIDGMHNQVLKMLCEVETAILNLGLKLPRTQQAIIVTESSNWAKEGDLTLMLIQDWGVLRLYQAFLKDWTRAFRNATAVGPGTCDFEAIKNLDLWPKKARKAKKAALKKRPKRPKNRPNLRHNPDRAQDARKKVPRRKQAKKRKTVL